MNAYSILDRSSLELAIPPAVATGTKQQLLQPAGKGLTLVESARRDLEATLQLLADRAQYITDASGAAIALRDGDHVLCRASSGSAAPDLGSYLDLNSGLSGESVRTRKAMRCDHADTDPRVDRESCRRLGIASFAVMPITRKDEVVGVFEIFSDKPHAFQERDLTALERLCEMVNIALDQPVPQRDKPAPFAVHGVKVKAMAAAAGAGLGAEFNTQAEGHAYAASEQGGRDLRPTEAPLPSPLDRIRACENCGFPVSDGRVLCVDCEAKGIQPSNSTLAAIHKSAAQRGMKSWIMRNRYIIGMVLISLATIAFALLH